MANSSSHIFNSDPGWKCPTVYTVHKLFWFLIFIRKKDADNYLKEKRRGMEEHSELFGGLRVLDMPEDEHVVPRWS